jgi:arginyl-tRNA synthetase
MTDLLRLVEDALRPVLSALVGHDADPAVRASERADAQVNGALALAKELGQSAHDIAQVVADSGALVGICAEVEVSERGFINLTFAPDFLARALAEVAADPRLGVPPPSQPRTILVDYSSPNVAKEMHVGHLRSTVIGDALVRMFEAAGHRVIRENHIGDWGRPFGALIEHLLDVGEEEAAAGLSLGDLDGFYKQASAKLADDPGFAERARARVVALQAGDPETQRLWQELVSLSARYFGQVYAKLGVLLVDADLVGESSYAPLMPGIVARLAEAGLLVESDGAQVVFPAGFVGRDGAQLPLIIMAASGGFNYAASDLAAIADRVERLGVDTIVYVVGAPQQLHFAMVFAVARAAGILPVGVEAVHVAFGNVLGPDHKMLRSRTGDTVKLTDLIDEAIGRAAIVVEAKNSDLAPTEQALIARAVGIGAVKYADLSNERLHDYVFDWDQMLAFEGNTGPYLQYAHARICSIFAKGAFARAALAGASFDLVVPEELVLARRLLGYPAALAAANEGFAPHRLCTYLFGLATDFSSFYQHCPVLAAIEPTRTSRLALADLTARTLAQGLSLLGIESPRRM